VTEKEVEHFRVKHSDRVNGNEGVPLDEATRLSLRRKINRRTRWEVEREFREEEEKERLP